MSRPDYVRCENCCYWNEGTPHVEHGECVRYPQSRLKLPGYCGEFRAEWPKPPFDFEERVQAYMAPMIERMLHPLMHVKLNDDGEIEEARVIPRPGYGVQVPEGIVKVTEEDKPST